MVNKGLEAVGGMRDLSKLSRRGFLVGSVAALSVSMTGCSLLGGRALKSMTVSD